MFAKLQRLGLGGIPLQGGSPESTKTLIEKMAEDGYFLIDSAKVYGVSEAWIGVAVKDRRSQVFLASKSMARDYRQMRADIADSLEKFQTDYIDLYQCHNIANEKDYQTVMGEGGAYQALLEAQAAGQIKHIGVSSHSVAFMAEKLDEMPFVSLQIPFNIIEEEGRQLLRRAKEKGLLTIAMKPLCGGVIADRALALRFFNNDPVVDIVLAGMAELKEYLANKEALNGEFTTDDEAQATSLKAELGQNFCRRCGYCLPCPVAINIPMVWVCELYDKRYGLKQWAKSRYNSLAVKADQCIGCGNCEASCPYQLKIIDKMHEMATFFKD